MEDLLKTYSKVNVNKNKGTVTLETLGTDTITTHFVPRHNMSKIINRIPV